VANEIREMHEQQVGRGDEPDDLDRFREEGEPFDRFDVRMQDRDAGRDREHVAHEQAGHERAGREQQERRDPEGQCDRERPEEDGADREAACGRAPLLEVLGYERCMDPGADRAREDQEVALQDGTGDHSTTTSPFMSMLCSVHSYL
jgi:hypothetical protein